MFGWLSADLTLRLVVGVALWLGVGNTMHVQPLLLLLLLLRVSAAAGNQVLLRALVDSLQVLGMAATLTTRSG